MPPPSAPLVDIIDPASLPAAMGSMRGQTVLVTGRVDGQLLYVKPSSGPEKSLLVRDLLQRRRGGRRQPRRAAVGLHAAPARRAQLAVAEGRGEGPRRRPCSTPASPTSSTRWAGPTAAWRCRPRLRPAHRARHAAGRRSARRAAAAGPVGDLFSDLVSDVAGPRGHRPACRPTCAAPSASRSWTSASMPGIPSDFAVRLPRPDGARPASACRCRAPGGGASGRRRRPASMPAAPATGRRAPCAAPMFLLLFLPLTAPARLVVHIVQQHLRSWS